MIKSENIKIKKIEGFDNIYIESELKRLGLEAVRWAVVSVEHDFLTVSVSYISKNN